MSKDASHFGQFLSFIELSFPHSGHFTNGIVYWFMRYEYSILQIYAKSARNNVKEVIKIHISSKTDVKPIVNKKVCQKSDLPFRGQKPQLLTD